MQLKSRKRNININNDPQYIIRLSFVTFVIVLPIIISDVGVDRSGEAQMWGEKASLFAHQRDWSMEANSVMKRDSMVL